MAQNGGQLPTQSVRNGGLQLTTHEGLNPANNQMSELESSIPR